MEQLTTYYIVKGIWVICGNQRIYTGYMSEHFNLARPHPSGFNYNATLIALF
jgi:hypothetical protein